MAIRVCIFEDNISFLSSITRLFENTEGFVLSGAFTNCDQLIKNIKLVQPDVILMDIKMPRMSGIDAVKLIREQKLSVKVVMQTAFEEDDIIIGAIMAGASGYILKNSAPEKFIEAVEEAYHGGGPMTPSVAAKVLTLFQSQVMVTPQFNNLTIREREVLQKLVLGNSYKMIASELLISYATVRFHMKNIYEKLQVSSTTEAVAKAIQQRII